MSRSRSIDPITIDPDRKIERRELAMPRVVEFSCPVEGSGDDASLLRALADWIDAQNTEESSVCLIHSSFRWCEETDSWVLLATVDG